MTGGYIDVKQVVGKVQELRSKFDVAVSIFADSSAQKFEAFAKDNRKWTDRSGAARQRLKGSAYRIDHGYRIEIAHGVFYGIYLEGTNNPKWSRGPQQIESLATEFAYERKYSILAPTIEYCGTFEVIPAFQKFLNRVGM
jgi:hypothetical protein